MVILLQILCFNDYTCLVLLGLWLEYWWSGYGNGQLTDIYWLFPWWWFFIGPLLMIIMVDAVLKMVKGVQIILFFCWIEFNGFERQDNLNTFLLSSSQPCVNFQPNWFLLPGFSKIENSQSELIGNLFLYLFIMLLQHCRLNGSSRQE